ncbi:MAG: hypothetical protein JWM08_2459, partial [Candidatus Angelobacter sp.]|nr:hypothetical protein [Candidatus Angelobacter sp.]
TEAQRHGEEREDFTAKVAKGAK